ncbi:MAG TPA: methylated-DNA--[protein]-cysteine S-methyltransferase [Solirubrobacteraceae bacterium]|nr:methylated-DNA--[protein]-cysteine S-methyltransferase [Solirubrobacteraceae bacterium]
MTAYDTVESPIGPLLITASGGALTRLYMAPFDVDRAWRHDPDALAEPARQLAEYFAGERQVFELELEPAGTAFQRAVWDLLLEIPYGETTTYGALAATLGDPRKVRAVGLANGRNPISIIVPCHRVIGADGSLVGYGGGLERKRTLLAHEAEVVAGFRATLW